MNCTHCGAGIAAEDRFCPGCGRAVAPPAAAPVVRRAGMSPWAWMLGGLLVAALVAGAALWLERSSNPPREPLTRAQEEELRKRVFDDLPKQDAINLDQATRPGDLPEKVQKKFDESILSAERSKAVSEAFKPLPKVGAGGSEIVDTARRPNVSDDFSDPASGWKVAADAKAIREYQDGVLQITLLAERGSAQIMAGRRVRDFALQIEATPRDGPPNYSYGVVVRQPDATRFVAFVVSPQGQYGVIRHQEGKNTMLAKGAAGSAFKSGAQTNVLKVAALDKYYTFSINGVLQDVGEIGEAVDGDIGVIAVRSQNESREPTRVAFDNFRLWIP